MSAVLPVGPVVGVARPFDTRHAIHTAVLLAVAATATGFVVLQQLVPTPWGLPGHRAIFWLSTLIASRLIIGRPATATRIAAASSSILLIADPSGGIHVLPYLLSALAVDYLFGVDVFQRHPWLIVLAAPFIHLSGIVSPFVHNLGLRSLGATLDGMWFYIQGHLVWGLAAAILGLVAGLGGRKLLQRFAPELP